MDKIQTIYIDKTYAMLFVFVICLIFFYEYVRYQNNKYSTSTVNTVSTTEPNNTVVIIPPNDIHRHHHERDYLLNNPLRDYDVRVFADPLTPPYKRDDYNMDPALLYPSLYSYSSRGQVGTFKRMGMLINQAADNTDKYKFLILMGRQKYRGSNTYEYYVTSMSSESNFKLDIPSLKKEVFSGDTVTIPELGDITYTASVDKLLDFTYNPDWI
uniref:Uncharacterized protein n=1 Tax=viral metagenome TaxID=1070528 RepID=A0A6C0EF20_9ZZZZ